MQILCAVMVALAAAGGATAGGVSRYDVQWDSPSADQHGSMPLGNGDVAVNAWVEADGDLRLLIAKTDAWDDNARLVKVGQVRIHLEPGLLGTAQPYRQTLSLVDGMMKIQAGEAAQVKTVRLWIDAQHPVIEVEIDSAVPSEACAVIELWRTKQTELTDLQVSDVMLDRSRPDKKHGPTIIEPDTVLTGQRNRVGWYHHNVKSVGPAITAEVQGLRGFPQPDPLLHRTFGAVVKAPGGQQVDDLHLRSPRSTVHRFSIYVLTRHPALPDQWLQEMDSKIAEIEAADFAARRAAHQRWWAEFWDRSWIRATGGAGSEAAPVEPIVPANTHPLRIGSDQQDRNRFVGELGRVSVFASAASETEVSALFQAGRQEPLPKRPELLHSGREAGPVADSAAWDFRQGLTIEAWVNPARLPKGGARIVDKLTPGKHDGFLLDTHPGNSLRLICGSKQLACKDALPAGRWSHVVAVADSQNESLRLYVDGKLLAGDAEVEPVRDQAAYVSQMYHLQRFITACAGRGRYPIKFNGSLFTVAPSGGKGDADYRRWGPGYWWQNTRLPYISMATSGDSDLMQPVFRMYVDEFLPLCKYRTRLYCGHDGAFYPECIYFWGAVFSDTYGWKPFDERDDKLQESRWHKWEWVSGLELCWLMLDYYDHTLDKEFLARKAIPFSREILTFFDQHYATDDQGRLVMYPSQSLETWWDCTNPMPELAGCIAVCERLLGMPAETAPAADVQLWRRLRGKLPPLPLREVNGRKALAPAERFEIKHNIENPELYAVFPFRLVAVGRPNLDWGLAALEHRWHKGHFGWRQDDIFMAYLGLAEEVRKAVVQRARRHDRNERFPAFWGPNYDWTPDQDHGGVLMKTFQAMLLQTDGRKIYLLPAWPKHWDVEFRLRAPGRTIVEGQYREGKLQRLEVTPKERAADVIDLQRNPGHSLHRNP